MQSQPPEVLTSRLILIAVTPETVLVEQAADGNYTRFAELIGCAIHAEWPPIHWEPHVFDFFLNLFHDHPDQIGWARYVALPQPDGTRLLIGTLGACTKEDPPNTCEIGYGILPSFEGNGYATEGTQAVIELLRRDTRVQSVIAHTYPSLKRSLA